jgi:hypothetical protein
MKADEQRAEIIRLLRVLVENQVRTLQAVRAQHTPAQVMKALELKSR